MKNNKIIKFRHLNINNISINKIYFYIYLKILFLMISIITILLTIKIVIKDIMYKNKIFYLKTLSKKKFHQNKKNIKVCICTIGKKENKYIREFISYYKNYGIDQIFLYDNNEINEEHFEDVIKDYINKGFVKVFNWRGRSKPQNKAINNCYMRYNKLFDWLIFYDIDEYGRETISI